MPNHSEPRPAHIAKDLVQRAHSPNTTQDIVRDAVLHKPLFLRPTSFADKPADARQARQRARDAKVAVKARKSRKPKPLSAKQKRALCLYEIPKEQQRYDVFEPLHRMWLGYIREVLGVDATKAEERRFVEAKNAGPILGAADLHGAEVEVVRCRCVGRVGLRGIIAKETKGTFEIITKKNELKGKPIFLFFAHPEADVYQSRAERVYNI
jgi:ribonuclease P protein subunit POP4